MTTEFAMSDLTSVYDAFVMSCTRRQYGCMDNRGPNYFEVDIDVSSSSVAKHVVGLVCGATKSITVDMAILLQVPSPAPCTLRI